MITSKLRNFVGSAAKTVKGNLGSSILGAVNADQGVLNSVLSKGQYLHNSIDLATSWINIFSLFNNEIPSDTNVLVNLDTKIHSNINYSRDKVLDGIQFIKDNYGDKFTISDASGLYYNLWIVEDVWHEDGKTIRSVIKTSTRNTVDDCLIYFEDDVLHFNQIIRSANFNIPELVPTNIAGFIGKYQTAMGSNFNGTIASIINGTGQSTIFGAVQELNPSATDILNGISTITPIINGYRGKLMLWWDIMRDYVQSSELNANILEIVQALSNGTSGLTNFMSTVATRINNAMSCIKQFWIDLSNAYAQGGFKGVVYFIYNFFKTGANLTDDNGLLAFTDNSLLVPRQYIAGMVTTIVTAVASLISLITSMINPVIGAVIGAAGALLYGVFKSIDYDASSTHIGLQTSERVLIPAAPFAFFQDEFTPSKELLNLLNDYPLSFVEVPGGYILLGPGSYDENKNIATVRCEFHPSIIQKFTDDYFDDVLSDSYYTADQGEYHYYQHVNILMSDLKRRQIQYTWANSNNVIDLANSSNDRLSPWNDGVVTRNILMNTFAFTYWIASQIHSSGTRFTGTYTLYGPGMTPQETHWMEIQDINFDTSENLFKLMLLTAPYVTNNRTYWPYGTPPNGRGCGLATWAQLSSKFQDFATNNNSIDFDLTTVIFKPSGELFYYNNPILVQNSFDWAIVPAKYDSATFLTWIIVAAIAVTVTAVVAVVSTFAIKKAIQNKRAEMNRNVEAAWDSYKKGEITYSDYRKTVKKANRWQTVIGGTRYDYENYWNGDTSDTSDDSYSPDESSIESVSNVCTDLINKVYSPDESIANDIGSVSLEQLRKILVG